MRIEETHRCLSLSPSFVVFLGSRCVLHERCRVWAHSAQEIYRSIFDTHGSGASVTAKHLVWSNDVHR